MSSFENSNEFYNYLQKEFSDLFRESTQKCLIFCIPPNSQMKLIIKIFGLNRRKMNYFMNSHLLRSSPYFVGEFINNEGKTLVKKENILASKEGFTYNISTNIIKQDVFYNKDFQPYQVWFIDRCLVNGYIDIETQAKDNPTYQDFEESKLFSSMKEMENYLKEIDEKKYQKIKNKIMMFKKSYVLLKGFEKQAQQKLNQYYQVLLNQYDEKDLSFVVKICIHSILEDGIYSQLFGFLKKRYKKRDLKRLKEFSLLNKKELKDFELPKIFCNNFDEAINIIKKISNCTSSIEKMNCIKRTLDWITNNIYNVQKQKLKKENSKRLFTKDNKSKKGKRVDVVTTDEIIPILSYILIQANIEKLESNLRFLNHCQIDEIQTTEYGFTLVSLNASMKFIEKEAKKERRHLDVKIELSKSRSWDETNYQDDTSPSLFE